MSFGLPFSFPYPLEAQTGYWDKVTSTIDWCEENYVVSPYVAEAMNTLSNSVFILLAVFAVYSSVKNKHEIRFAIISLGFMLVGVGSWLFHMTLKYEFQLLDELPMIYATCVPMWSIFSEGRDSTTSVVILLTVIFSANLLTAIYMYFKDPTIHQVAYAIMNVIIVLKSYLLTEENVHDERAKKNLFRTMGLGIAIFLSGYFLWNMDVHFCDSWIDLRRFLGMPYGFFFELHSWWHILTGTGVYFYVVYLEYLRLFLIGKQDQYEFINHFGFLPEIVLKKEKQS
ncbi:YDC1 [Cyberlindnera jadinii]|uniref:YDC1 protein n=1 Tax=Cyberlindnera jadinii (strain ATCC 18201 / CBS 1600 / BCRC 20928 / JCM 3617 / NBRC 0987 / NRRL Y-1542) TaxID=983966 RepID=A0A0H5C9Q2_CYBJN|nr:YDC1 [Cyberlindnera jadinii]